jgi:hypothetical protein
VSIAIATRHDPAAARALGIDALGGAGGLVFAATLVVVFTVALTNGGRWLAAALVGFVAWIVFFVRASVALLRRSHSS